MSHVHYSIVYYISKMLHHQTFVIMARFDIVKPVGCFNESNDYFVNMVTTQNNPSAVLSVPLFGPGGNATKADPTDARVTNRLLIFGTLFPRTLLSRAAIARKTGLSKMAVTKVVQELIDEHLLKES